MLPGIATGWDLKFLKMALLVSTWSKDPSTKVGCVIVDDDHTLLAEGYNGFPIGVKDNDRLLLRELKYRLIVHGEANAVAAAARKGTSLKGGTAYMASTPNQITPCSQCSALLIQAGIVRVVCPPLDIPERWSEDCKFAMDLLSEAGVKFESFSIS